MNKLSLIFIVTLLLCSANAAAAEYPAPQDKYVNDFADVLTPEEESELRDVFSQVENETTAEMVFVSVQNVSPLGVDQYTFELASEWGVGKADKDNGLVILYAKDENRVWVATGYGVEGILPDSRVGRMLDEYYVPSRDLGFVNEGIMLVSEEFAVVMIENKEELISGRSRADNYFPLIIFMILFGAFIIFWIWIIAYSIKAAKKGKKHRGRFFPIFIPSGKSSSGGWSSGGGFSGGGFGGGGFGGGGAGR